MTSVWVGVLIYWSRKALQRVQDRISGLRPIVWGSSRPGVRSGLVQNSPRQGYRRDSVAGKLEKDEKDVGVLVTEAEHEPQCAQGGKKANSTWLVPEIEGQQDQSRHTPLCRAPILGSVLGTLLQERHWEAGMGPKEESWSTSLMMSGWKSWGCLWGRKRGSQGTFLLSASTWKEVVVQVGVRVFSQGVSDRTRGDAFMLHQEGLILKNFFTLRVVRHRNRLHREVVKSPSLEALKKICGFGPWWYVLVSTAGPG